jgi:hypothetical protein
VHWPILAACSRMHGRVPIYFFGKYIFRQRRRQTRPSENDPETQLAFYQRRPYDFNQPTDLAVAPGARWLARPVGLYMGPESNFVQHAGEKSEAISTGKFDSLSLSFFVSLSFSALSLFPPPSAIVSLGIIYHRVFISSHVRKCGRKWGTNDRRKRPKTSSLPHREQSFMVFSVLALGHRECRMHDSKASLPFRVAQILSSSLSSQVHFKQLHSEWNACEAGFKSCHESVSKTLTAR